MICTNKHDRFWAAHSKKKPDMFSNDFKSLVSAMLAFDPTQRPSIAEIISHPWFNGPTATYQEVAKEFTARKNKVEEVLKQEREALQRKKEKLKEQQAKMAGNKNMPMNNFGPMFRGKGPVRDIGDDTTEDLGGEEMKLWNEIETKMNEMKLDDGMPKWKNGNNKPLTQWWSAYDAKSFFQLCFYVSNLIGTTVTPNVDKWRINVKKNLDEERLEFDIRMFEDEDGFKVAEFMKKEGPLMEFYDVCKDLKEQLDNNSEIDVC